MRLTRDEGAALPVLEAMLAATLIFGAILFFAFVNRPTAAEPPLSDGSTAIANGLAQVLVQATMGGAASPATSNATVDSWLEELTKSNATTQATVRDYMSQRLPPGDHFVLRLHNGFGAVDLLNDSGMPPASATSTVASAFVVPPWSDSSAVSAVAPGRSVTVPATTQCISGPNGRAETPGGASWFDLFEIVGTAATVPPGAYYGVWSTWTAAAVDGVCLGASTAEFRVTPDGTASTPPTTRLPVMLQVVVWHG